MNKISTIHINKYLKSLCDIQIDLTERLKNVKPKLSPLDKQQEELLHLLELNKLNAPQRAKAVKRLVEIRKERRAVKQEIHDLTQALKAFKMNVHKQLNYEYKLEYSYSEETIEMIYEKEDKED